MQDYTIFIIGCFIFTGLVVEVAWTAISYTMRKLEYFFYHRYLDKISRDAIMEHVENPVVMVNDKNEEYYVGYGK